MTLGELVSGINGVHLLGDSSLKVTHITHDSRAVIPGAVFVALPGRNVDGRRFVPQALSKGAAAIGLPTGQSVDVDVPTLWLDGPRPHLADLCARFYGEPAEHLSLVGLTGTNGKTTVTHLVASMCKAAGQPDGLIGTLGHRIGQSATVGTFTTPEAPQLQAILAKMVKSGVQIAVMEVSSIGLSEHRVSGLKFAAAGFLNLTADHLDYHGTMSAYGEAKRTLFTERLRIGGTAVIDIDDEFGDALAKSIRLDRPDLKIQTVSVSRRDASYHFESLNCDASGIRGRLVTPQGILSVESPLLGQFNGSNMAMAVGLAHAVGLPQIAIESALKTASVRGRLERVQLDSDFEVVVDYAHTPDALERVLDTLRPLTMGSLWCVFGCGGDRDAQKRQPMGRAATRADILVVTNDNPRTEKPNEIADGILEGVLETGVVLDAIPGKGRVTLCLNRRNAIQLALTGAQTGDVVLIAGKGHETYQEIHGVRHDFDDVSVVRQIASELAS